MAALPRWRKDSALISNTGFLDYADRFTIRFARNDRSIYEAGWHSSTWSSLGSSARADAAMNGRSSTIVSRDYMRHGWNRGRIQAYPSDRSHAESGQARTPHLIRQSAGRSSWRGSNRHVPAARNRKARITRAPAYLAQPRPPTRGLFCRFARATGNPAANYFSKSFVNFCRESVSTLCTPQCVLALVADAW